MQLAARQLKGVGYAIFGDTEEIVRSGNWHGNDTCWRMTLDLNRILSICESRRHVEIDAEALFLCNRRGSGYGGKRAGGRKTERAQA